MCGHLTRLRAMLLVKGGLYAARNSGSAKAKEPWICAAFDIVCSERAPATARVPKKSLNKRPVLLVGTSGARKENRYHATVTQGAMPKATPAPKELPRRGRHHRAVQAGRKKSVELRKPSCLAHDLRRHPPSRTSTLARTSLKQQAVRPLPVREHPATFVHHV